MTGNTHKSIKVDSKVTSKTDSFGKVFSGIFVDDFCVSVSKLGQFIFVFLYGVLFSGFYDVHTHFSRPAFFTNKHII